MDGRTISSSKLVGSRGIMRGFLDMISFKCLEVSMMLLCCMNPINVRLTCANANFIPKEVKDSSFSGCTNHHQEDERIPQKGTSNLPESVLKGYGGLQYISKITSCTASLINSSGWVM